MAPSRRISIKLTDDQQQELERAMGKTSTAIAVGVEELEEGMVPSFLSPTVGNGLADPRPSPMLGGELSDGEVGWQGGRVAGRRT